MRQNFDLSDSDIERCLFFSRDQEIPFIPTEILIRIARSTGDFASIEPDYSTYVHALEQLVYKGTVVDRDGRSITRIGVATLGEKPGGYEIDTHKLAESRALGSALSDAGFNPLKPRSVVKFEKPMTPPNATPEELYATAEALSDAEKRRRDLSRIHVLARDCGLLKKLDAGGWDTSDYRKWLQENFGSRTASILDETTRAQVINKLSLYPDDEVFFESLAA
ncbi:MAG: hypothetical protein IPM50_09280 [Acidobacteriota bacterium]|nr:MAG: hypothetical protein IPM50_09280 [Acidobacteriota bacterium]